MQLVMQMKTKIIIILLNCLMAVPALLQAQTVVTLNGAPTFNTSQLTITEAGNDFASSISEIQASTTIDISNSSVNNPRNYDYRLFVNLVDMPASLNLTIQRTGPGTSFSGGSSQGKISGPMTPITLSTLPVEFINGTGDRRDIPVRFGLSNVSVTQPAGNVTFILQFTATGI